MFELVNHLGHPALMRNGQPFRYSSHALAAIAKHYLDVRDDTPHRIREGR